VGAANFTSTNNTRHRDQHGEENVSEKLVWRRVHLPARSLRAAYKSRPSGRRGVDAGNGFRNAWLRSLRASLFFRSRCNRALSPLRADMVPRA
jgi:hypothetical protein